MNTKRPGVAHRVFGFLWNLITWTRVVVANLLFLFVMLFVVLLMVGSAGQGLQPLPNKTGLRIAINGYLVDQRNYVDPLTQIIVSGQTEQTDAVVRDVVDAITAAADDERITKLLLDLNKFLGGGLSKLDEVAQALTKFKASGKEIIAISDNYTQAQYYLASFADRIYLHPMGSISLTGLGAYPNYYKDGLDKLAVNVHVFRVGDYKDAVEPYIRNDMSEASREHNSRWINEMWDYYTTTVENQRQLPKGSVNDLINNFDQFLEGVNGDAAQLALNQRLVDQLATHDEIRNKLSQEFGKDLLRNSYQIVDYNNYLTHVRRAIESQDDKIGLIVASGTIYDGQQPPGNIGGDTLAGLFRQAREDNSVKAIVLRIDSGGGSAFASEIIRDEILATKAKGKPIIVSMGSVAASGGYWIAANADEIWATPTTITGSIGVFGILPTIENSLEKLGIHSDGVGTTDMADFMHIDRPLSPLAGNVIQHSVDNIYRRFINLVAEGRNTMPELIHPVAQGRVWSATDALEYGLVDQLGYLNDAIAAAAKRANLSDYNIKPIEKKLSPFEQLMFEITSNVASAVHWTPSNSVLAKAMQLEQHDALRSTLQLINTVSNSDNKVIAHCLLCTQPLM